MAMSRSNEQLQLEPGLFQLFGTEYEEYPAEHLELYDVSKSDRSFEQAVKLTGIGAAPVKQDGAPIQYDRGGQEAYNVIWSHQTIAYAFAITQEAIEDNLYKDPAMRYTKSMARGFAYTKQVKAAAPFNNGFTTFNSGDGTTVFSTSHPLYGAGGSIANRPSVHADLNEAAIEAIKIAIASWVDDRGILINSSLRKLVIPPALEFVAERITKSVLRTGTADNDISAMVSLKTVPGGYTVNHFLTDPAAFYVKTDIKDGFRMFERVKLKIESEGDFETGNYRVKARERYSFNVADYLQYWGNPGS